MQLATSTYSSSCFAGITYDWVSVLLPVTKNSRVAIEYTTAYTTAMFRFIYAEGN